MKLYAYQPKGHGSLSFFVLAESEKEAYSAVEAKIAELREKSEKAKNCEYFDDDGYMSEECFYGWGTSSYRLIVVEPNQVVWNYNS